MANKSFTETINELKDITSKLNDSTTSMEDSIELFKKGSDLIKIAKVELETIEGEVKKVISETEMEDFK